jgi:outer membrane protein OmpA-like peptidoglycan-associated protein
VGLSANLAALRGLGGKPLYLGAASATIIGAIGLLLAALVGPRMHLPVTDAAAATATSPARMLSAGPSNATPPMAPTVSRGPRPEALRGSGPPSGAGEEPRSPSDANHDGVANPIDACRHAEGSARADPARTGCPQARIEEGQVRTLEPIAFRRGTAAVLPASRPVLLAIVHLLQDHPEIKKVSVQAYTDERASRRRNVDLSRTRARAVTRWLTAHKVARQRLQSQGLGQGEPIDAPRSDEGPRHHHQRLEIRVVEP